MSERSSDTDASALRRVLLVAALAAAGCAHRRAEPFVLAHGLLNVAASPAPVPVAQDGHAAPVTAIDIDPTGTLVVTAVGAELLLWEVATGRVRARIDDLDGPIRDVAFSWSDPFTIGVLEAISVMYADEWGLKRWSLDTDVVLPVARDVTRVISGNAGEIGAAQGTHLLYGEHRRDPWRGLGPREVRQPPALRSFLHLTGEIEHIDVTQWDPCVPGGCIEALRAVVSDHRGRITAVDLHNGRSLPIDELVDPCGEGPLEQPPTRVALSLDGRRVAAAFPGRALVWEIEVTRRLNRPIMWNARPHRGVCLRDAAANALDDMLAIAALQFDYDGEGIAIAGADGSVRAWDLKSDRVAIEAPRAPASAGRGQAAIAATRGWLVFEEAGEVTVRNLWTGAVVARFPVTGRRRDIVAVDLSTQRQLAVARDDRVEVWDLDSGALECFDMMARHAAWSPDGRRLAAWERQDGPAVATPRLLVRTVEPIGERTTRALALTEAEFPWPPIAWADANHLIVPVRASLELWDVDAGARVTSFSLGRDVTTVTSLAAASGTAAAIARGPKGEHLFSLDLSATRSPDSVPLPPTTGPVAVSHDGLRLATAHGAHPTTIWDARELQPIAVEFSTTKKPSDAVLVALTHDATMIARRNREQITLRIGNERADLRSRPIAADVAPGLVAIAAADGVHLRRTADWSKRGVHLVSASEGRCDGLVLAGDGWIDAGAESSLLVRLGSPFAGALVPASALPKAIRREHLLRDFADGVQLPATFPSANPPELRDVRRYGRRVVVDLAPAKRGPGLLCVELRPADGSPPSERCIAAGESHHNTLDFPAVAFDSLWVRACDASKTVCGRSIRAHGYHRARGHRRGE